MLAMRYFLARGGISLTARWLLLLVTNRSLTEHIEILNCPMSSLYTKAMSKYFRFCSKDGRYNRRNFSSYDTVQMRDAHCVPSLHTFQLTNKASLCRISRLTTVFEFRVYVSNEQTNPKHLPLRLKSLKHYASKPPGLTQCYVSVTHNFRC